MQMFLQHSSSTVLRSCMNVRLNPCSVLSGCGGLTSPRGPHRTEKERKDIDKRPKTIQCIKTLPLAHSPYLTPSGTASPKAQKNRAFLLIFLTTGAPQQHKSIQK
ncbi:hypothetical protein QQF64_030418 [Cirrhinus molitorella]|uniref:Uncharacterized protein n=1 Tax=Cirrhinus molitorella TaxID=172907 RepID=A0ABR3N3I5_9TELE